MTRFESGYAGIAADPFNITGGVDRRISDPELRTPGSDSSVSLPSQLGTGYLFGIGPYSSSAEIFTFRTDPPSQASVLELMGSGRSPSSLRLLNNVMPGFLTANADYQFKSVSYAKFIYWPGTTAETYLHYFGYPTSVSDIPGSGAQSFSTIGLSHDVFTAGTTYRNDNVTTSVSTVTVNYAAKTVTLAVTITSNGIDLGSYSGIAAFTPGANQFTGTLTASGSPLSGNFSGSLFGSNGSEVGLAFALNGTPVISGTTGKRTVIGLVLGK